MSKDEQKLQIPDINRKRRSGDSFGETDEFRPTDDISGQDYQENEAAEAAQDSPDPVVRPLPPREKRENIFTPKRGRRLRINHYIFFTCLVTFSFFGFLIAYLVKFTVVDSPGLIVNPYNKRNSQLDSRNIRGQINSADGMILAYTDVDEDGHENRIYEKGELFSHVLGYCSDQHGKSGLEAACNFSLLTSHQSIIRQIKNDLKGRKNNGDSVVTTLDYRLQSAAYNALEEYMGDSGKGTIVAIEPKTGKVRAMVSMPDFDPNEIDDYWESFHEDDRQGDASPLMNRAISGLYPPGSTYKVLTALEYMDENPVTYSHFSYDCEGETVVNSVRIHCYKGKAHGEEDLTEAFAKSCNTAFVTLAADFDKAKFAALNKRFLFNQRIDFVLNVSKSLFHLNGQSADSALPQTVIGQGDTLMTPFHNALIMCAIANGGRLMKPQLVDRIVTYGDDESQRTVSTESLKSLGRLTSQSTARALQKMLRQVVKEGTGTCLDTEEYEVAGKTGSAENARENAHSWFVGYSGGDDPDLVVCVLIENVGSGSAYAAPAAKEVFDCYYENEMDSVYKSK